MKKVIGILLVLAHASPWPPALPPNPNVAISIENSEKFSMP